MTKKRLSDLLRQEAQKSLEEDAPVESSSEPASSDPAPSQPPSKRGTSQPVSSKAATPATPTAKATSRSTKSTSRARSPKSSPTAASEANKPGVSPAQSTSEASHVQPQDGLVVELEGAIANLKAELSTAQETEASLRQKVTHLESALQQQHDQVEALKAEADHATRAIAALEQTKAELEQTKQVILTLSEQNIHLTQEIDSLKQQRVSVQTHSTNLELRRILAHPTLREQPSTDFSDADIGWVD